MFRLLLPAVNIWGTKIEPFERDQSRGQEVLIRRRFLQVQQAQYRRLPKFFEPL